VFIPSALEGQAAEAALTRTSSIQRGGRRVCAVDSVVSEGATEAVNTEAFDWAAEEAQARTAVSLRAASAEAVWSQTRSSNDITYVASTSGSNPAVPEPSREVLLSSGQPSAGSGAWGDPFLEYDAATAAEAVRDPDWPKQHSRTHRQIGLLQFYSMPDFVLVLIIWSSTPCVRDRYRAFGLYRGFGRGDSRHAKCCSSGSSAVTSLVG